MARKPHLSEALADARRRTDELFDLLVPEALYDRPIPERNRNIFYLGHLEAFDWNQICRGPLDIPSFHPEFDKLFEFGIDPPAGRLPEDQPADPTIRLMVRPGMARRRPCRFWDVRPISTEISGCSRVDRCVGRALPFVNKSSGRGSACPVQRM